MKRLALTMMTIAVLGRVTSVQATPITYTETVTATGSLGASTFTNALVTIVLTGDTSTVSGTSGGFVDDFGSATVNVLGIGTATFTDPSFWVYDNPFGGTGSSPVAGIADVSTSSTVLSTQNVAFVTYDLRSAIGPLSGPAAFNSGELFATSLGNFDLTSVSGGTSTFTATAVPEPASLLLLGAGLVGCCGRHWRKG